MGTPQVLSPRLGWDSPYSGPVPGRVGARTTTAGAFPLRGRWLKPEFFRDRKMAELGPLEALVFQALWCLADDGGTAPCDPDRLKGEMFFAWSAVGVPEITGALRHLSALSRVKFFQAGDELFCDIVSWPKHQTIHKPSAFRYRVHYSKQDKAFAPVVPQWCRTGEVVVPTETGTPHLLDSKTPRHLDKSNTAAHAAERRHQT